MNANQFLRWLQGQGIKAKKKKGHGHKILTNPANGKTSEIPMHGGKQQLGIGLLRKIKKDLGLE